MIYGHNKTIHGTTHLDVETHKGKVVSVWFRCMGLPFEQHEVASGRATDMERMSEQVNTKEEIHAVDIKRRMVVYLLEKPKDCTSYWYFTDLGSAAFIADVHKAKRFNSQDGAEHEKSRFGLDNTWKVVQHVFYEE